jgi:hypothetical protein
LKRFTWRGTGARSKLDAHVDFPLHSLDLSPYMETDETNDVAGAPKGPTGRSAAATAEDAATAAAEMAEMATEMAEGLAKRPRRMSASDLAGEASEKKVSAAAAKAVAAEHAASQARDAAAMAMATWIDSDGSSKNSKGHLYDLAAAVVHHGAGACSGHYTVFARSEARHAEASRLKKPRAALLEGRWAQFNDDKVLDADPEDVKASDGYLFFYARREEQVGKGRETPRGKRF